MSRYRKVDPKVWNDEKFSLLSDKSKLVFFFLLTHPHMTALGAMRASRRGLAAELRWSFTGFCKAYEELLSKGMVRHDDNASFLWLPNFLKYNGPESPNAVKSWAASLDLLPECNLKYELLNHVKALVEGLPEAFREALPEDFAKSMPNQEQEQENKKGVVSTAPNSENQRESAMASDDAFERAWRNYPKRAGGNSKKEALKAWTARVQSGVDPAELAAGVERYARYIRATGKEGTEYVKQASTFFGPNEHWKESWEIPAPSNGGRSAGGFAA